MSALLELRDVSAGYGRIRVLRGLTMSVPAGSIVALIGPNGVGKTTALRTIAGLIHPTGGQILLDGQRIDGSSPYQVARAGLTLMPEGRGVFPSMTVAENLAIAARAKDGRDPSDQEAAIAEVYDLFGRLAERRAQIAGTMSGGEQQMLALGRALLADPKVLIMDEISMGLAPLIVEALYEQVAALRERGTTIVMVEQFLTYALRLADVCYVMRKGAVSFVGDAGELASSSMATSLTA